MKWWKNQINKRRLTPFFFDNCHIPHIGPKPCSAYIHVRLTLDWKCWTQKAANRRWCSWRLEMSVGISQWAWAARTLQPVPPAESRLSAGVSAPPTQVTWSCSPTFPALCTFLYIRHTAQPLAKWCVDLQKAHLKAAERQLPYGITCHSTQVNAPSHNPTQTGRYSIYLVYSKAMEGWVDLGVGYYTKMVNLSADSHLSK